MFSGSSGGYLSPASLAERAIGSQGGAASRARTRKGSRAPQVEQKRASGSRAGPQVGHGGGVFDG